MNKSFLSDILLNNHGQIVFQQPSLFSFFHDGVPYLVQAVNCRITRNGEAINERHVRVIGILGHAPLAIARTPVLFERLTRLLDNVSLRHKFVDIVLNQHRLAIKIYETAITGPFNDTEMLMRVAVEGVLIDSDIVYEIRGIIDAGKNLPGVRV
ncbi:MAG: hypothetical protein K0U36_06355 [Alphaproteobacteria bacterium]|nr:hypothetical protein [Alphaproteobacteria bacterium]